jgi:predicted transcriptional regulator
MATTTLRIPEDLKIRVTAAAESAGVSPHGFMLKAIEALTAEAEEHAAFERLAEQRWKEFQRSGEYYTLDDVRGYMLALARGETAARPPLHKLPPDELARLRSKTR